MLGVASFVSAGVVLMVLRVAQAAPSLPGNGECSAHIPQQLFFLDKSKGVIRFNISGKCVTKGNIKLSRYLQGRTDDTLVCSIFLPVKPGTARVEDDCFCRQMGKGDPSPRVECELSMAMNLSLNNSRWTLWGDASQNIDQQNLTIHVVSDIPEMHQTASRKRQHLLRGGDVITCTVTGRDPQDNKNNVQFNCSNPHLHSNHPTVTNTSVSRAVTVTTTGGVTEGYMLCVCIANWTTATHNSYPLKKIVNYTLEHQAVVTRLTLGHEDSTGKTETETAFTVNSSQRGTTLRLVCDSFGRPRPTNVKLTRPNGSVIPATQTTTAQWTHSTNASLSRVTCPDTGSYTCAVNNGVNGWDAKTIFLNVNCSPERQGHTTLNMTQLQGVSFTLVAFPVPETFVFNHHGNSTSNPGQSVPPGKFSPRCTQGQPSKFKVSCEISLLNASGDLDGYFTVTVGNALGDVNVSFRLLPTNETDNFRFMLPVAVIIFAILILVTIAIVVVIVVVSKNRNKKRDNSNRGTEQSPPIPMSRMAANETEPEEPQEVCNAQLNTTPPSDPHPDYNNVNFGAEPPPTLPMSQGAANGATPEEPQEVYNTLFNTATAAIEPHPDVYSHINIGNAQAGPRLGRRNISEVPEDPQEVYNTLFAARQSSPSFDENYSHVNYGGSDQEHTSAAANSGLFGTVSEEPQEVYNTLFVPGTASPEQNPNYNHVNIGRKPRR